MYIGNDEKLINYFCDYIEKHFDEITDEISLQDEFENMWPVTLDYMGPEYEVSEQEAFRMFKHAFGIVNNEMKNSKPSTMKINEAIIRKMVAESLRMALNEYGNTPQGLGNVAKNVDRRTSQMDATYANQNSGAEDRIKSLNSSFEAQRYLAQAIQNAREAGMSDEQIEQVLQQNMSKNYNPKFNKGTLTWGKK